MQNAPGLVAVLVLTAGCDAGFEIVDTEDGGATTAGGSTVADSGGGAAGSGGVPTGGAGGSSSEAVTQEAKAASAGEAGCCGCEARSFGNRTYLFCTTATPWMGAAEICLARGCHLVSIDSQAEDDWLTEAAASYWPYPPMGMEFGWWIGFNDGAVEKQWVWSDGSPTTYTHWAKDQPSGNGNCVQLNPSGGHVGWDDHNCDNLQPFICESLLGGP